MGRDQGDRLPAEPVASTTPATALANQARDFGQEMAGVLLASLPDLPVAPVEILASGDRFVIRSPGKDPLPLFAVGQRIAGFKISVSCQLDSAGVYLAIYESTYDLLADVDRAPLLRFHYREKVQLPDRDC